MSDFSYQIKSENVYRGYAHQACRSAVLVPLAWRKGMSVPAAYAALQTQWRLRVQSLAKTDVRFLSGMKRDLNIQYMRNCPPFGVLPMRKAMTCNKPRICPNCYGREVLETFDSIRRALLPVTVYPDDIEGPPSQYVIDVKLVGLRRSVTQPSSNVSWTGEVSWPALVKKRLTVFRDELDAREVAGARMRMTLSPGPQPGTITSTRSTLVLVRSDYVMPTITGDVREAPSLLRKDIAALVAWCFKYPVGMMRGDIQQCADILDNMAGVKMSAASGLLDNDSMRALERKFSAPRQ